MNKEEVRKHIAIIHNMAKDYGLLDNEEISRTYQVIDYISNLEQENKKIKMQLDQALKDYDEEMQKNMKAIEYIEKNSEMTNLQLYGIENILVFRGELKELLEILKGEENE